MKITLFVEMMNCMREGECKKAYPDTMGGTLKSMYQAAGHEVTLYEQNEGDDATGLIPLIESADLLVYWAHSMHGKVHADVAPAVKRAVLRGMGVIFLHSAHRSKAFMEVLGVDGALKWREVGENERLWVVDPTHPIAAGIGEYVDIPHEEMYGEPFCIPTPDELVFIGWFKGGEVFRSGAVFKRGRGKVFYFQPGHETFPVYKQAEIQKILLNAAEYIKCPTGVLSKDMDCPNVQPLEKI